MKGTRSIVRQLNLRLRLRSLFSIIIQDCLLFAAALTCWGLGAAQPVLQENNVIEKFRFTMEGGTVWERLQNAELLFVVDGAADETYTVMAGRFLSCFAILALSLLGIQLLIWLFGCLREYNMICRLLRPIDEIALEAERLSTAEPSMEELEHLEDALDHIQDISSETQIHVKNQELAGLEAAVNNLLRRLGDSYRQQSRFVDDASHELRTPIAVIQGYVRMLDRWGKTDAAVLEESIAAIQQEADHMQRLVDQLLFLARGDRKRQALKLEPVALGGLLQELYDEFCMIDTEHQYEITVERAYTVSADAALFKQAVRILIDNAVKYTPKDGKITLRLSGDSKQIAVEIQDTGIGIAPEALPHLFERFYRSDQARGGAADGAGLGLSIAKWIVDRHGGSFSITSALGVGSRFSILLPYSENETICS